jgi:hypothetical protein
MCPAPIDEFMLDAPRLLDERACEALRVSNAELPRPLMSCCPALAPL